MKKPHPLLIVIFIAAAVAVLGYAYVVFSDRYGNKSEEITNSNQNQGSVMESITDYLGGQSSENVNSNQNENTNGNANQNENTNLNTNTNSPDRAELNAKDCDNDCARFKSNTENYKYCQQVCGDTPISKKNSAEDCANLSGDEKDYCLKDLAISKSDYTFCNQIQDSKIKKVCKDRITEDLIN